tara:strand:- start:1262 stop:1480 length:219 start_codon:yes stop_codon:yes gene_type:complete
MNTELKNKVSQVTDKLGEATETLEEVIGAERDQLTIQWDLDTANRVETMEEKLHVLRNTKKCLENFQQFTLF